MYIWYILTNEQLALQKKNYPVLDNELDRLRLLHSYDILGTQNEEQFDNLTGLTAQILGLPVCQITLMDADWQEFISNVGIDMDGNQREMSFCQYTVVQNKIFEIKNTTKDPRFKDHPFVVAGPKVRYYVGAPLIDDSGLILGTLCGYGMEANALSAGQKDMLLTISKTVMRLIKYRKSNKVLNRYANIFNLNQGLLCVISKKGFLKMVNPAFTQLLGWSEEKLLAEPLLTFIYKADRTKVIEEFRNIQYGNAQRGFSCRIITKAGYHIWFDWSYFSDEDSSVVVASGHDMSQLLATQESLKTAINELNKASKIKDRFMSNMSHEIRTPLATIRGFTELLLQNELNPAQRKNIDSIDVASEHLMNIVNDVLDIHKLEEGKLNLEHRTVNLKELTDKMLRLFQLTAAKKNILLKCTIENDIPTLVKADETRLIQVLSNLIGNAIKFTNEGQVELKLSTSPKGSNHFLFEIIDTGIGVKPENLETIFQRFSQAEDSTSRLFGGTGLGLSITKHIIDLFGGTISIDSTFGKGTRVWFEIELESAKDENSSISKKKGMSKPLISNILLAEDNENIQLLCKLHIERNGGKVDLASSGKAAIELLKLKEYDIILMDIQMPEMDGITATSFLRSEMKIYTPVIGFSANADPGEELNCREAGMYDFISKPFDITTLIHKIQSNIYIEDFHTQLQTIIEKEGSELVNQFLEIFKKRIPDDISELMEIIETRDSKALNAKAHFLTSTFSSMNFKQGEELASKICNAVKSKQNLEAFNAAQKLIHYLQKAITFVKSTHK